MAIRPYRYGTAGVLASAKSRPQLGAVFSTQRAPTDPIFYSSITLQNIVVGSRYWIAQASDLTNVLAVGVAASIEEVLTNLPAYTNPMLVEVRVRNASDATAYFPYVTYGYLVRDGATVYIAQVVDNINL